MNETDKSITVRGEFANFWKSKEHEIILHGGSVSGKTFHAMKKMDAKAAAIPGSRFAVLGWDWAMIQVTSRVNFESYVLRDRPNVRFSISESAFVYPNGSRVILSGLNKITNLLSAEFDGVYVDRAEEISEANWKLLMTRLRHGRDPFPQIVGECNSPVEWMENRKRINFIYSTQKDNPYMYDELTSDWTPTGHHIMWLLNALTGERKEQLLYGYRKSQRR